MSDSNISGYVHTFDITWCPDLELTPTTVVVQLSTVFHCAVTAEILPHASYSLKLLFHAP